MATPTTLSTTLDATEWTGLFKSDLETKEQSLLFVKRMMAVAVSTITYLRGVFPEDAYQTRYLEDLCIKVLRKDSSSGGACELVKWMMGSFDALEKAYVCPNTSDVNHIIESYQIKFVYTEDGPQMDFIRSNKVEMTVTMGDTKKASVLLIRKLFLLMQNLDVLPDDVALTMRLYYYDNVTPSDYEPPGFEEGVCEDMWFEGTAVHFKVGEIQTPFHAIKVRVDTEQGRVRKLQEENFLSVDTENTAAPDPEACQSDCFVEGRSSDEGSAAEFKKSPTKQKTSQAKKKAKRTRNEQ